MIDLNDRLRILFLLEKFLSTEYEELELVKKRASVNNRWFTKEFVSLAINNICSNYLEKNKLIFFCETNELERYNSNLTIGIVMSGNIPLVGFHDFLCCFLCGTKMKIKLSSKDNILLPFILDYIFYLEPSLREDIEMSDNLLKNCSAYLTMGSNVSSSIFKQYFDKYPALIRSSKTSVAILDCSEESTDLDYLSDDIMLYFGLGCRSVNKLYVPFGYDFRILLKSFDRYNYISENRSYKNNYDYNMTLLLLNKEQFMSNEIILLVQSNQLFSPISQVNYEFYTNKIALINSLSCDENIQCIVSKENVPFGRSQFPELWDFPDNKNIIHFIKGI